MKYQKPIENGREFREVVSELISGANELLGEVIRDTKLSDNRAKAQKTHWTERHRLQVLLEAAEETQKSAPNTIVAPWFLAELAATLDVVRKWRQNPCWPDIEKYLKDREVFNHTIAMLHVAEHLKMGGHDVQVVKEGLEPSPDLMLKAIGGTQEMVVVECYQPAALRGKPLKLNSKDAENIVETSMEKAKRQIGSDKLGIIAICGYNQSAHNLKMLGQVAEKRLYKTERVNFCGFWLIMLGVTFHQLGNKISFQASRSAEFIQSPAYFGEVDIVAEVPTNNPNLIKGNLRDMTTDALVSGNMEKELSDAETALPNLIDIPRIKAIKLNIIQKPEGLTRSVIHGKGSNLPPLFTGQSNINYHCGQCGVVLVEHAWKQSLNNIVIQCPKCQLYNETAILSLRDYPTVLLSRGDFYFSNAVKLKPGRCLRGE
ncbi:MAG: hypothetical protein ABR954_04340 [Dehalococcoidales bacterium]